MSLFKNVVVFRIDPTWSQDLVTAEAALQPQRFVPCAPSQEKSAGWFEPRGEAHGPLVESVGGQWLLDFMIESKAVPASVVKRKIDERCAQIEAATGRKPGRKEKKDMKEDITHELMPLAFTRQARIAVWIDPERRRLVVNSSNATRADEVVTALVKSLEGFGVTALQTNIEPASAMADWLHTQEAPAGFTIDRECELKASDESKSTVRYAHHALDIDEVRAHIAAGKRPTRLAMTWDDRISFELTDGLLLRKIVFLEGTDAAQGDAADKEAGFDADAAIATGELGHLVPDLLEALGGEMTLGAGAADREAPKAAASGEQTAASDAESRAAPQTADDAPF